MKNIKTYLSLLFILSLISNFTFAQQDYKIVQDFKTKVQQIKEGITRADSLSNLNQFETQINQLAASNAGNKVLLDKSLYPDDFNGTIEKLRKELEVRREDFTQITTLETQVSNLNMQIDELNKKNAELLIQVRDLSQQSKVDKNKIAQLQRSISSLRASLRKRDELVIAMIDSLIPEDFRNGGTLTSEDKQSVFSEAQKKNVLDNVQNAVSENVGFLKSTTLKPDDLKSIREKKEQFEKTWRSFGPQLIEIYSEKGKNVANARKIDATFAEWDRAINMEAWTSINQEFINYGINLNRFSNGKEFTQVMLDYIQDELKNAGVKGENSAKDYLTFADTAWYGNIKPEWVSYLIDNDQLTVAQRDTIEAGISKWKEVAIPETNSWIYIIIAILASILIFIFVRSNYKKKHEISNITINEE